MRDPRVTACIFCFNSGVVAPATYVAPQHTGGDTDIPATWVPVCETHLEGWYDDLEPYECLPIFTLPSN